jgi:hypothetical protein
VRIKRGYFILKEFPLALFDCRPATLAGDLPGFDNSQNRLSNLLAMV